MSPRSGVCSAGSAVTRSIARISRSGSAAECKSDGAKMPCRRKARIVRADPDACLAATVRHVCGHVMQHTYRRRVRERGRWEPLVPVDIGVQRRRGGVEQRTEQDAVLYLIAAAGGDAFEDPDGSFSHAFR